MKNNSSIRELIDSKLLFLQKQKSKSNYWNITSEQGIFLTNLVSFKSINNVLEIGTSNGFSTLCLARGLNNDKSKIYTVEVDESRFLEAKSNFNDVGLKNIIPINCEAIKFLKDFDENIKFDFIFIDAGHKFYPEIFSLILEKNLASDLSTIVFDNVSSHKILEDFISDLKSKFDCELIDIGGGMLVLFK